MDEVLKKQDAFFKSGRTKDLQFRLKALNRLYDTIKEMEGEIVQALHEDLSKPATEAYMTEIGLVLSEITYMKKNLKALSADEKVHTPISQFPSRGIVISEPYGRVLIISPWNYPFLLAVQPAIDAIAAGNTVVIKPSEFSRNTSKVLLKLFKKCFPSCLAYVALGDAETAKALLDKPFDYIFYTGGERVGRLVMQKAAENLTPVTLELGGKSPCIVDASADLKIAAKRIMFGKIINAGQTCVAPDYVLVEKTVRDSLIKELGKNIYSFLGDNPIENKDFSKIINTMHFDRLLGLLEKQENVFGGRFSRETMKIEPTIVLEPSEESCIMKEEIFGPILPILSFETIEEAFSFVSNRNKPLAAYMFTKNKKNANRFLKDLSFGSGCVNDTVAQLAVDGMGFGGVGKSGMGAYHGKIGFETFSHKKGILKKSLCLDIPIRYMPYCNMKNSMLRVFLK